MKDQQSLFDAILRGGEAQGLAPVGPGVATERGLAAYRNNLRVLSAQALAASFPGVLAELGESDFAAMAWSFWRAHPPERGDLACWGQALPAFLADHAGEDSGLPALARRDWAVHEAERAADAELDADSLPLLASAPPERIRLALRPAVRMVNDTILVWRAGWRADWRELDARSLAFFRALLQGQSLQAALNAAAVKGLAPSDDFDFSAWLQDALRHEWLHRVTPISTD